MAQPAEQLGSQTVIVDLDGTLALMNGRGPFDWHEVGSDLPNPPVVATVRALHQAGHTIVYMSGRDGSCFDQTRTWIDDHVGVPGDLYMRAARDFRKDSIVKRELFERHIAGVHDVLMVIDDRRQVVDMWRNDLGLTCLQVAEGNF